MKGKERRLDENDMRMLRQMCVVTKKDKIRKRTCERISKVAPVTTITEKKESVKRYRHATRREEGHTLRRVSLSDAPIPGMIQIGRRKNR